MSRRRARPTKPATVTVLAHEETPGRWVWACPNCGARTRTNIRPANSGYLCRGPDNRLAAYTVTTTPRRNP